MKIFYPLEVFYPSQAGGPANTVYWITKNIVPFGFEPIVVATDKGIGGKMPLDVWVDTDGVRAIYVRTRLLNFPLRQTLRAFGSFLGSDAVHVSSVFFPTAFAIGIAARIFGKRLVWSVRGELDTKALRHSRIRKTPILQMIRLIVGIYPLYHSTCDEETEYIRRVFGEKARVVQIPNYLEVPAAAPRTPGNYLLYIGRIHPKKAIDRLLQALAVSEAFKRSEFVLKIAGVGKPEFEAPLRKLSEELGLTDRVEFVGQVEGDAKQQLYADAHFTIMPSHTENFGIVVLESLAQGTPVVASTGSPWQSLETERVGYWIDNEAGSIARTIGTILEMPSAEYESMRERARPFVLREFDIRSNIEKWVHLYGSL